MGFIGDLFGSNDAGEAAADASIQASKLQADYMQNALDYLKEREALPTKYREGALQQLAGLSGVDGGYGNQQEMIDRALKSPLYGAIMGGQKAGEEAILRNAAATGGLRSGDIQSNLYDYNTQLKNQALLEAYNQQVEGLTGLAGLPSNANQIAAQTSSIGQTLGQGQIAAAQARQTANQQGTNNLFGLANTALLGYMAFGGGEAFCDRRLKTDIRRVGTMKGFPWYTWRWNTVANKMGMEGTCQGIMADEVYAVCPEAVFIEDMFMMVNYKRIGIL